MYNYLKTLDSRFHGNDKEGCENDRGERKITTTLCVCKDPKVTIVAVEDKLYRV